ncbi:MAG: SEC59/DGK1/VTE5 family protein [Candidatus Diapherotrites archaeon]|nr:SEC59/DGK1/VTE5 family protein [Candidatus Diapherotrites archaeon]
MKKELQRKFFHIVFGLFFIFLILAFGTEMSLYIITALFLFGLLIAIALRLGHRFHLFEKIISMVEREHEKHLPGKGALLFFAAAIILLYFFRNEPRIVIAALSVEVFADTAAALGGQKFGRIRLLKDRKKTVEGSIICFVVTFICIAFFFPPTASNALMILLASFLTTASEYLPLDDNITIPLVAAASIKLLL